MSTRKKIAFVTSSADPNLISDDRLALAPLSDLGIDTEVLVWDKPTENLESFDALIFRSCWNYHKKQYEFINWLNSLRNLTCRILNPIEINIWNLSKKYLLDLEGCGVVIPETTFLPAGSFDENHLDEYVHPILSDKIVIKPAVSLNGEDTFLFTKTDVQNISTHSAAINKSRDLLLQQFIPEVQSDGELSLIYFNKKFSHAIRKVAKDGEFRIHEEHGGSRAAYEPEPDVFAFADSVVDKITDELLFCRVDLIRSGAKIYLIELEILDPMLFLGMNETAPRRFAESIRAALE